MPILVWRRVMPVVVALGLIGAGMDVAYRKMDPIGRWADSPGASLAPVRVSYDVTVTQWTPIAGAPKNEGSFLRSVTLWSQFRHEEIPKVEWADERAARLPSFLKVQAEINRVPERDLIVFLEEPFVGDQLPSGFSGKVVARRADDLRTIYFIDGKRIRTEGGVGVKKTVVTLDGPTVEAG